MSRDYARKKSYKRQPPKKSRKGSSGSMGYWLITLIFIGLFVGFLFYLKSQPTGPTHKSLATEEFSKIKKSSATKKDSPKTASQKPRFDFYTILPKSEAEASRKEKKITKQEPQPLAEENKKLPEYYLLQVASFPHFEEADNLKAELILLGYEATIKSVTSNNKTWHRVFAGPFKSLAEAVKAQTSLQNHQIKSLLLKTEG